MGGRCAEGDRPHTQRPWAGPHSRQLLLIPAFLWLEGTRVGRRLRGGGMPLARAGSPSSLSRRVPEAPGPIGAAVPGIVLEHRGPGAAPDRRPPFASIPASLGTSGKNKPSEAAGPGRCPSCIRRTQVQRARPWGGAAGGGRLMNERARGVPAGVRGWGARSQPCCYSDHSASDSQTWIMNISEDFDVRVEIYQQIQWGRNIKCKSMPALCQRY